MHPQVIAWSPTDLLGKVVPTEGYLSGGADIIVKLLGMVMLFAIAYQGFRWLEGTRKVKIGQFQMNDPVSEEGKALQRSALVSTGLIAGTAFVIAAAWGIGASFK